MLKNLFNKLIALILLLGAVAVSGYVYYIKYPGFHSWVDTTFPKIKEQSTHLFSQLTYNPATATTPAASPAESTPSTSDASTGNAASTPAPSVASTSAQPPLQHPAGTSVDIAQLSQSRAEWPKTLVLKNEVEFPAVLDGKIVGSVKAPAGSQVNLIMIKDGKIGIEYQGGGAMVVPTDTNLIERVLANRQASNK